jgi:hypothetical protein
VNAAAVAQFMNDSVQHSVSFLARLFAAQARGADRQRSTDDRRVSRRAVLTQHYAPGTADSAGCDAPAAGPPVGSWCASSYAPHEGVPVSTGFFFPDLGVHVV